MFLTRRSSTHSTATLRIIAVVILCLASRRRRVCLACRLCRCRTAFMRFFEPFCLRAMVCWIAAICRCSFSDTRGRSKTVPSDSTAPWTTPASTPSAAPIFSIGSSISHSTWMETYQYAPCRDTVTFLTSPTISRCMTISHPACLRQEDPVLFDLQMRRIGIAEGFVLEFLPELRVFGTPFEEISVSPVEVDNRLHQRVVRGFLQKRKFRL